VQNYPRSPNRIIPLGAADDGAESGCTQTGEPGACSRAVGVPATRNLRAKIIYRIRNQLTALFAESGQMNTPPASHQFQFIR
jgi:hypothetical protein